MTSSLLLAVQLVIASAIGAGLFAACRWLHRRSTLCARIVVAGLLLRAVVTLFLFWTSYLNLPILRPLQTGGGFWALAVDAPVYYEAAFNAATSGLDTVAASLACFLSFFARNPDQRRAVVEDPSRLKPAVEELMRFESPVTGRRG